jgi:oligoendopeptidase F
MSNLKSLHTGWNLTSLFTSDKDPKITKQRKKLQNEAQTFINKWQPRKDYLTKPTVLRQALDEYEYWSRNYSSDGNEGYYIWLRSQLDQNNPRLKAKLNDIINFSIQIENQMQFFPLRLSRISKKYHRIFLTHPKLAKYQHYLERLFAKSSHLLSEPEEKIVNLKYPTSHLNWTQMTQRFLAKVESTTLSESQKRQKHSFSQLVSLMNSPSKPVRDSAAGAFNRLLTNHLDVAEAELNSVLANKQVDDQLRSFPRPDQARHLADDIDSSVVDSLVKAVSDRFYISKAYYQLKAQLLHVKKLKYHERNVPYGRHHKRYSFTDSAKLTQKTLHHLDPEFSHTLNQMLSKGQIDVFPKKGKAHGAFCAHGLLIHPIYVLLNHTDKLQDVLTLAHELGHALNDALIQKSQHALNYFTPKSTAEVASTFFEDFVLQALLRKADPEERLALQMTKLNEDISSIFRQIAFYRFEQDLHKNFRSKHYLSHKQIGNLFSKHMQSYMGDFVEQSPGSQNWWLYVSHFRRFFYVYSYASGLLISKYLQNQVHQNPAFITQVKTFLSAGTSDSPQNLFKSLDINISDPQFWHQGLDEVEKLLTDTKKLAKKLGKLT